MNEQLQAIARTIYAAAERPRTASTPVTDETRTQFQYRIDLWDDAGDNIVEQVASLEDFAVAQAAYDRACRRWPKTVITLRRGTQVVETTRRGHL